MRLLSRLVRRLPRGEEVPAQRMPHVLIAERFVAPVEVLRRLDLPDDLRRVSSGKPIDAIVIDEFGTQVRRARIGPPPRGMAGTRLEFAAIPGAQQTRFWLFAIEASEDETVGPDLRDALLRHGRALGGRRPINLVWDDPGLVAPEAAIVAAGGPYPPPINFAMLSEQPDPALLPPLDQPDVELRKLTQYQQAWRRDGVVTLRQFFPDDVLDPYIERRMQLDRSGGWSSPAPYLHVAELRTLCLYQPLRQVMRELIGEEMMLHLNLTGWVSTERNWHQDDYLNPPFVNSWYAAVWVALDRIDPDSGPFEYVPGSHRWPVLRGAKVRACMTQEERESAFGPGAAADWPKITERVVVPAIEAEIRDRGITPRRFLGEKGDALIWHGRLFHRGSTPARPELPRRAVIAHYSGVNHRPDMMQRASDAHGGTWAVLDIPLD